MKQERPSVTVVVTAQDEVPYLQRAIESVVEQTRQPEELLLIDAGSRDGSRESMDEYADAYPSLISRYDCSRDTSIPAMRNLALELVDTEYLTFLDGDDWFVPTKLQREVDRLAQSPGSPVVFSDVQYVDAAGDYRGTWCGNQTPPTGDVLFDTIIRRWPREMLPRSELLPRSAVRSIGGYDEDLKIFEDWDMKIRLATDTEFRYCPDPLSVYRRHEAGVSRQTDWEEYIRFVGKLTTKHQNLMSENLIDEQTAAVERGLYGLQQKYRSLESIESGNRSRGIYHYLRYLSAVPHGRRRYRLHSRVFMPSVVFTSLQRLQNTIQETFENGS